MQCSCRLLVVSPTISWHYWLLTKEISSRLSSITSDPWQCAILLLQQASIWTKRWSAAQLQRKFKLHHEVVFKLYNFAKFRISVEGKTCLTGPELVAMFLKLHGLLKCQGKVDEAKGLVGIIGQTLTALIATQNFGSWKLIQVRWHLSEFKI